MFYYYYCYAILIFISKVNGSKKFSNNAKNTLNRDVIVLSAVLQGPDKEPLPILSSKKFKSVDIGTKYQSLEAVKESPQTSCACICFVCNVCLWFLCCSCLKRWR